MRHSKINSKKLAAALLPVVLAGGILAPAAAVAGTLPQSPRDAAAQADAGVRASRGFDVVNHSSHSIKLKSLTGDGRFEGRPEIGSVIKPGASQRFEVQWQFFGEEIDNAHYAILDANGRETGHTFQASMGVDGVKEAWSYCVTSRSYACTPTRAADNRGWNRITTLVFKDAPNTSVTIPGGKGQEQADVLKQICDVGGAKCTFTPTREEHTLSNERNAGAAVANPYDLEMHTTIHAADKVGISSTLGGEISVGIDHIVQVAVTLRYETTWTKEHEFSQDITVKVPPLKKLWFTHKAPVIRDTGNFTVTLANTTWHLDGVSFDSPDLSKQAEREEYVPHVADATAAELAYARAHPHPHPHGTFGKR